MSKSQAHSLSFRKCKHHPCEKALVRMSTLSQSKMTKIPLLSVRHCHFNLGILDISIWDRDDIRTHGWLCLRFGHITGTVFTIYFIIWLQKDRCLLIVFNWLNVIGPQMIVGHKQGYMLTWYYQHQKFQKKELVDFSVTDGSMIYF